MNTYDRSLRTGIVALMALAMVCASAPAAMDDASPNKAIFTRPLTWRADSLGMFNFTSIGFLNAAVREDGSVGSGATNGTCELLNSYETKGPVRELAANWSFTGKVKLEVSVTGDTKDYVRVTNGVPVYFDEKASGNKIRWRATLGPESSLTVLSISYKDHSGVAGSFGSEFLSGFASRKEIYIKGSTAGDLYNHQVRITVGESIGLSDDCDVKLPGGILSSFADVRFTQADGETVLPHYLERISGSAPDSVAQFWVRIPEIPSGGLSLYLYFGKAAARDISSGEKVFEFFDDFDGDTLDNKKWKVTLDAETGTARAEDSYLTLNMAKALTAGYKFSGGIIEYEAAASPGAAAVGIVRQASGSAAELAAYSSQAEAAAHCIIRGSSVVANDPKPTTPDVTYKYSIYLDDTGKVVFKRYAYLDAQDPEAEVRYDAGPGEVSAIGLYPSNQAREAKFRWIRARRYADPQPQVDLERTALSAAEAVDLPAFDNIVISEDGALAVVRNGAKGYYTSRMLSQKFDVRMIRPSWQAVSADAGNISVRVTTDDSGYSTGWANGVARYVSKKEFEKGRKLRFRAEFPAETEDRVQKLRLTNFGLEYQPGTIRVVLPNGGETIKSGSQYSIFWEMAGYDKDYPVEISYARSGSDEFEIITSKIDNTGDYVWNVPNEEITGALVKVADYHDKAVYGISEAYFAVSSNVTETDADEDDGSAELALLQEETIAADADETELIPQESVLDKSFGDPNRPGVKLYELLVKAEDDECNNTLESIRGCYKRGDILVIKPAGWNWSDAERGSYIIVRSYLTDDEINEVLSPRQLISVNKKTGQRTVNITARRRYRISVPNRGFLKGGPPATGNAPLVGASAVDER